MSAGRTSEQPKLRLAEAGASTSAATAGIGDDELGCLIALAGLPGFGPATLLRVALEGDPVEVWSQVRAGRAHHVAVLAAAFAREPTKGHGVKSASLARASALAEPDEELDRHRADGREVRFLGGPGYPERLCDDPAPPALLFVEGRQDALDSPTVAMVGTRNATRAGRELASDLAADLARSGVAVVSGLALGIDGAAHAGALGIASGADRRVDRPAGQPVGVIASGLDIAYPRRHQQLHRDIVRHGLLVSETPLGRRPTAWRFPARNRIIAGLADAVVIVESRSAGGSMLTAAEGLLRDRPVLAVPGHPTAPAAAGANDLIFDGAVPVRDVEDILVAIGRGGTSVVAAERDVAVEGPGSTGPEGRSVLCALGTEPLSLDEVVQRAGLTLDEAAATLVRLEVEGSVIRSGSWFERAGRPGGGGPCPGGRRR